MTGYEGTPLPTTSPTPLPTPVPTTNRTRGSVGVAQQGYFCLHVVDDDGGVWYAGYGEGGRLGSGTSLSSSNPVYTLTRIADFNNVQKFNQGGLAGIALTGAGEVWYVYPYIVAGGNPATVRAPPSSSQLTTLPLAPTPQTIALFPLPSLCGEGTGRPQHHHTRSRSKPVYLARPRTSRAATITRLARSTSVPWSILPRCAWQRPYATHAHARTCNYIGRPLELHMQRIHTHAPERIPNAARPGRRGGGSWAAQSLLYH